MFRLLKLKPPNGWSAVAWELAIVTLGVLIALGAQEWAQERASRGDIESTNSALRAELAEHYGYAVEFRVVYPCLQAQLDQLRIRVLSSGSSLDPAPIHKERDRSFGSYVLRIPFKFYPTDAWDAAINDGIVQRFDPSLRRQLAGHYAQLVTLRDMNAANLESGEGMVALAHRLPLDPAVRYSIIRDIEQLTGRLEYLNILNGQVIDYIQRVRMVPSAAEAQAITKGYGTYHFCKAQGLPLRPFKEAMQAVPN
jgi:hypothetical protein